MSVGARKAAKLLRILDSATAAELLKSLRPEAVKEVAAELACLDAGEQGEESSQPDPVGEFFELLNQGSGRPGGAFFLDRLLETVLGKERSQEVRKDVEEMVRARDRFLAVRSTGVEQIAAGLQGESATVAGLILSEMPPQRAGELLSFLADDFRTEVVRYMTSAEKPSAEVRLRLAGAVRDRLEALRWKEQGQSALDQDIEKQHQKRLRRIAVILQGLDSEHCESPLKGLAETDPETCHLLRNLMVIWDDVPRVADRCMQEALRGLEVPTLALALYDAEPRTAKKVRSNVSARVSAMVDEELSLLSSPKAEKVLEAREMVLNALREMSAKGDLTLEEG